MNEEMEKKRYEVSVKISHEGFTEYYDEKWNALSHGDLYYGFAPDYAVIKVTDLKKGKVLKEYGTKK